MGRIDGEDDGESIGSHGIARGRRTATGASSLEAASGGRHRARAFLHGFALVRLALSPGGKEVYRGGLNWPELDQRWLMVVVPERRSSLPEPRKKVSLALLLCLYSRLGDGGVWCRSETGQGTAFIGGLGWLWLEATIGELTSCWGCIG